MLGVSYKDYEEIAGTTALGISQIRGLNDMIPPISDSSRSYDSPVCPGFTIIKCMEKAQTCHRLTYSRASSSFTFNCTNNACGGDCDQCEHACKCCTMLVQFNNLQSGSAELMTTFKSLDDTVRRVQYNLSIELDLTRSNSFHSLLSKAQSAGNKPRKVCAKMYCLAGMLTCETLTVQSQDRSCHAAEGLGAQYRRIRNELCDNLLIDQDIQWFCIGFVALITTPWLTLLLLTVREGGRAHAGTSLPPAVSSGIDVRAQLYHDDATAPGSNTASYIASPAIIAAPMAAQALRGHANVFLEQTPEDDAKNWISMQHDSMIRRSLVAGQEEGDGLERHVAQEAGWRGYPHGSGWTQNDSMTSSFGGRREEGNARATTVGLDWTQNDSKMSSFGGLREDDNAGATTFGLDPGGGAVLRPLELDLSRFATCCTCVCLHSPPCTQLAVA